MDKNRMIKRPGVIKGGFYPKNSTSAPCPSVVIAVEDLTEAMKNVTDAGGKILGEPVEIPGIGHYVSFNDAEGNRVSILQPKQMSYTTEVIPNG